MPNSYISHIQKGNFLMTSKKQLIVSAAILAGLSCAAVSAEAADTYALDPIIVTAQRSESAELKTPAAVSVLTAEDLQKTGATGMQEALKYTTGLIIHAQGPRNISQGTMTNKVVIRGVEKGTLVLVDGVPLNQGGRYNLEDIPVDIVDRVEVVRGGGAVLYGSEAAGGVINIITKGQRPNRIKAGFGTYGIQNYAASIQAGKLGVSASYDHTGRIDNVSNPSGGRPVAGLYYNTLRGEHANFNARYDFNDTLFVSHTYGRNSDHYQYRWDGRATSITSSKNGTTNYPARNAGAAYKDVIHSTEENLTTVNYDNGTLKANLFYNRREQKTRNSTAASYPYTTTFDTTKRNLDHGGYTDQTIGLDVANRWKFDKGTFMLGYTFTRELQENWSTATTKKKAFDYNYSRNMHSVYGQIAYDFTEATRANLNFRETWVESDGAGHKYDKFTPELILMHDLDANTSLYAKAGKSFMMPTFSQLYGGGSIIGTPGLKPQSGVHYEIGAKKNIGKNAYRLAVYHYAIDDSIEANTSDHENITYSNEDIKNTGIELEWFRNQNENLSYHIGLTYSNPEKQERAKDGTLGQWHKYYGQLGVNAGVTYTAGKLTTAFNLSYLGDRTRDSSPYQSMKAQLFSDLNFSYKANKECRFFLNIDNLFNRRDIISTSSSTFYNLGRNVMVGCEYTF